MTSANISMDLTGWFGDFQRELDALLTDMFQLRAAAQEQRYSGGIVHQAVGLMGIMIPNAETLGETAPQRAARNAFIGAMSKFSTFLDRLIASRRLAKDAITITRDLQGEAELLAYVNEVMEEAVAAVARDPSLNVPKKLDHFAGIDPAIKDMALSYNALRSALEHHHDLPKRELKVTVRRIIPLVGDQEITALPVLVRAGGTLGIRPINVEKVFPADQKVVLEPQDAYDLLFTLRHIIAVGIFDWHVGSGNPRSASAP